MSQFTCSHHGIIICEKITTYLDAKGTSKNTSPLCELIIQSKTPDFTHKRIYARVKLFYIQHNIGDFHKEFYIELIKKLAHHSSCYKIIGKNNVAGVRHKEF